ncbi:hypothetical protein Misp06_01318 [Microbulbifer sp. NBRC 101763]|uniref:hypothetical protein n=1 Tax=Microbulbifer sp. NBRC 101763 TaxID=1113820 RepID=UPI0030B4819A
MTSINTISDNILLKLQSIPGIIKCEEIIKELQVGSSEIPDSTPALLLRLVSSEPIAAFNNGVQPLSVEWEIIVIVGNLTTLVANNRAARDLAVSTVLVFEQHLIDSQAKLIEKSGRLNFQGLQPLQLNETGDGVLAAYTLRFTQKIWVGEDRRHDLTPIPKPVEVHVGYEPKVGLKHRDDYTKIGEVGEA